MVENTAPTIDHHTLSNWDRARVTHTDFDLAVDMESKTIHCYCVLTVKSMVQGCSEVVLDTRALKVYKAEEVPAGSRASEPCETAQALKFEFGAANAVLGEPLKIQCPSLVTLGTEVGVGIHFEVTEASTAVQFLTPAQTASKEHPFLFTQCQAIHARSLCPCQDTPSVKMTYSATVTVAKALTALMSAEIVEGGPPEPSRFATALSNDTGSLATYAFRQRQPMPAYLLALAVGMLESRVVGPRSRIWAEPPVVEAAAWEFAETESFLAAAEELTGMPYMWGQYDMLVLPPSFPYGGMENPCMTFLTPSLITGDRSATFTVAHEISHSWTGNWVSNATWEHFWLNEGWTVLLERKIIGKVWGAQTEQFHALSGLDDLRNTVASFGADHPYTKLVPDLKGIDPDDSFSSIPYEKGFYFLYYLQTLVGGPDAFAPFAKSYLTEFGASTATTEQFKTAFLTFFADCDAIKEVDWDTWLFSPGMPPDVNVYDDTLMAGAEKLALHWHEADASRSGVLPSDVSEEDVKGWTLDQRLTFVGKLTQFAADKPLLKATTRHIDKLYQFDAVRNPEVRCAWVQLCIMAGDEAVLADALAFAGECGRMKFVRPLYRALHHSSFGKEAAMEQFVRLQSTLHPIARKMVASDLGV